MYTFVIIDMITSLSCCKSLVNSFGFYFVIECNTNDDSNDNRQVQSVQHTRCSGSDVPIALMNLVIRQSLFSSPIIWFSLASVVVGWAKPDKMDTIYVIFKIVWQEWMAWKGAGHTVVSHCLVIHVNVSSMKHCLVIYVKIARHVVLWYMCMFLAYHTEMHLLLD